MSETEQHLFKQLRQLNTDKEVIDTNLLQIGLLKTVTDRTNIYWALKRERKGTQMLIIVNEVNKVFTDLMKVKSKLAVKIIIIKHHLKNKGYARIE